MILITEIDSNADGEHQLASGETYQDALKNFVALINDGVTVFDGRLIVTDEDNPF